MQPLIESGQHVIIEPLDVITTGDIVLCKVKGTIYLHLVKAISNAGGATRYMIGNNKGNTNGWCSRDSVYGVATMVNGKKIHEGGMYRNILAPSVAVFFISAVHLKPGTPSLNEIPTEHRTLGFFTSFDKAKSYVLNSEQNTIYQKWYEYAVIEEIREGIRWGTDRERLPMTFFRWDIQKSKYVLLASVPEVIRNSYNDREILLSFVEIG